MNMTFSILTDEKEIQAFQTYADGLERRALRDELLPIMIAHLKPITDSEKSYLESGGHVISGALVTSLSARSGRGDWKGKISVFSAPTASTKILRETWGKSSRSQHRRWAAELDTNKRRRVFYGPIVHQGHGNAKPIPFAQQALDSLGEQKAEELGEALMKHILGE